MRAQDDEVGSTAPRKEVVAGRRARSTPVSARSAPRPLGAPQTFGAALLPRLKCAMTPSSPVRREMPTPSGVRIRFCAGGGGTDRGGDSGRAPRAGSCRCSRQAFSSGAELSPSLLKDGSPPPDGPRLRRCAHGTQALQANRDAPLRHKAASRAACECREAPRLSLAGAR